ncbi:hypothetical protein L9F63_012043, partial [Diploptera punctata]
IIYFILKLICAVSNGVSWFVEIIISRRNLWMIPYWQVFRGAWPETFCVCGGEWPRSSRPPPRARTPRTKVLVDPNILHSRSMPPRSSGSSGMAKSPTSQDSSLQNLSPPMFLFFFILILPLICDIFVFFFLTLKAILYMLLVWSYSTDRIGAYVYILYKKLFYLLPIL